MCVVLFKYRKTIINKSKTKKRHRKGEKVRAQLFLETKKLKQLKEVFMMKTIKTIASVILSSIILILALQASVATIFQVLSIDPTSFLPKGAELSGNLSWANWLLLVTHHSLMVYALLILKKMVNGFSKASLLSVDFARSLKVIGLIVTFAELIMSYLNSQLIGYISNVNSQFVGYISIDLQFGVYLLLAGFACSYARSYMAKHHLTF